MSQIGKLISSIYIGLCRLWLTAIVKTIIKLKHMMMRYVRVEKTRAGILNDGGKVNEGKVSIVVGLDELRDMAVILCPLKFPT